MMRPAPPPPSDKSPSSRLCSGSHWWCKNPTDCTQTVGQGIAQAAIMVLGTLVIGIAFWVVMVIVIGI